MFKNKPSFNKEEVLHNLSHFLPAQAPLKDFIHHNTLHAFQHIPFHDALNQATQLFGYKVYLTIAEYRTLYKNGSINEQVLNQVLVKFKKEQSSEWKENLVHKNYEEELGPIIGQLRDKWKTNYHIDLDSLVHPLLFRVVGSYLDQGISIWNFPVHENGFLASLKELEKNSLISFFKTTRVKELLLKEETDLERLLQMVVGKEEYFEQYLFDQQFAHSGWSGMVSVIENNPNSLIDQRAITLEELIRFELLLEIDALDDQFGNIWAPLGLKIKDGLPKLSDTEKESESFEVRKIYQEALEWSYYDTVLGGLQIASLIAKDTKESSFQALFCIDDRECSLRRHIEEIDPSCQTFGTAGFFNVEFYFQPEHSEFKTKVCPAPVTPKFLIKEVENKNRVKQDFHFGRHSHGLFGGWILTHTLGFWSALRLFFAVFKPSASSSSVSSSRHMDKHSILSIENVNNEISQEGLQVGFTIPEMTERLEGLLKSIGLTEQFASLIYLVGHGSSSVNNTHYAGYDCGACSGRPGSVNARVAAHIGNDARVRSLLKERGITIPEQTQFVGALHDTSRDEMIYYDLKVLSDENFAKHKANEIKFNAALSDNAKERSRRFMLIDSKGEAKKVHEKVKLRTISLFEPRPELNHATNTLCIVGRREFSERLFLDRRSFLNSYDFSKDSEGKYLLTILNAVAPVCGGINLEYYFSRVDNQKLGAGTKLPHNVMGLIGVANGIDGDLRTGLPSQMIEVHDPLRLMVIVEQDPAVVLETIQKNSSTYEWFRNDWVKLSAVHPLSKQVFVFENGQFSPYEPFTNEIPIANDFMTLLESTYENIPVHLLKKKVYGTVH
jgi:uncharacterized protein